MEGGNYQPPQYQQPPPQQYPQQYPQQGYQQPPPPPPPGYQPPPPPPPGYGPQPYGPPRPTQRPTGITILAVLYILEGLMVLATPIFMTVLLGGTAGTEGLKISGACWAVFGVLALIYLLIAYGLLKGQSWARIVAIIFAIFGLLNFPIGTIISIIILIYLFKPEVKAWFQ